MSRIFCAFLNYMNLTTVVKKFNIKLVTTNED